MKLNSLEPPWTLGYYQRDEVQFYMNTRPNRFQQIMTNWFFGWKWHDTPPPHDEQDT